MCSSDASEVGGVVSVELTALLTRLQELARLSTEPDASTTRTEWIDRIKVYDRLRGVLAAAQYTATVGFARAEVEHQLADERVSPREIGRGIGHQIGLACRASAQAGSRRLTVARTLWADMPHVRALLAAGEIHEDLAEHVVSQTSHLSAEQRRTVDAALATVGLARMGRLAAEAAVKTAAYDVDRAGYVRRGRTARKDRRVTLRPAPDTMSWLSMLLPAEQGVAAYAALSAAADAHTAAGGTSAGNDGEDNTEDNTEDGIDAGRPARTRDQVMADTAVARLTGKTHAEDVDVEVSLVIPWDALHPDLPDTGHPNTDHPTSGEPTTAAASGHAAGGEPDRPTRSEPTESTEPTEPTDSAGTAGPAGPASSVGSRMAELVGYGPIPMEIARDILASTAGKRWWRRLFTAPATDLGSGRGPLIGGDPRRRRFDGFLARLLGIRDHGRCRDPYCNAVIRHYDHIRRARAGGPTSLANGRGVCERGNYVREMPDWHIEVIHDGLSGTPHTTRTTTPTGHVYESRAGP